MKLSKKSLFQKIFEKWDRKTEKHLVFCVLSNILAIFKPVVGDFYKHFSNQGFFDNLVGLQKENMHIHLSKSKHADLAFMRAMLYEAVFWRPNPNKPSFETGLAYPGVSNALVDWGARAGDTAVIALAEAIPAGAAWYRFYTADNSIRGYLAETIPVIVIAVHENYRRQGIGEKMMIWLLEYASQHHIEKLSLMVSKDNHALRLYWKCGFREHADAGDSLLMLCRTEA